MRRTALGRALIASLLAIILSGSSLKAAQLTPFKIGISEAVNTALALWTAEAAGLYEAEGLKVEIINMSVVHGPLVEP